MKLTKVSYARSIRLTVLVLVCLLAVGTSTSSLGQYDPPRPALLFKCPRYSLAYTTSIELIGEVLGVKAMFG